MNKKTVRDIDFRGKRALVRVDFNVPLKGDIVSDDTRILAVLPTILHILDNDGSVVLMSHLGRPHGMRDMMFSLFPVAGCLSKLLGKSVAFAPDCIGPEVASMVANLSAGKVLLLENLRFHPEEEGGNYGENMVCTTRESALVRQHKFAQKLAMFGDVYVNDAFGAAHRGHASITGVMKFFDECVAGFLIEKEICCLGRVISSPERPFLAILGGAKVSGKINVLMNLEKKVDVLIVGGAMVYTFYLAMGISVGDSLVEDDCIDIARKTLQKIKKSGTSFFLPIDHLVANEFSLSANTRIVGRNNIGDGWQGMDIGPATIEKYISVIKESKTIFWNGPMGCFEMTPFANGTTKVAQAIAESDCVSIVGGGDSVSALNKCGLSHKMTHVSTGGGASLEFLEGKELPGIAALSDKR